MKLALDAGHGLGSRKPGRVDSGAVGNSLTEANVAAGMATRLAADFLRLGWDVRIVGGYYARRDDEAAEWGADAFVSLHLNAGGGYGVETLVGVDATKAETKLAANIQHQLVAMGFRDRGVKVRTDLAVLRQHPMSSVLVEMGFIDSAADMARFQTDHARRIELALVNGILSGLGFRPVKSLPRQWGPIRAALSARA